jgi:hypothetical protein
VPRRWTASGRAQRGSSLLAAASWTGCGAVETDRSASIRPHPANPYHWAYQDRPVLLLGGSDQDNLFNHPELPPDGLAAHLDRLVAAGGNSSS